MKKIVCLLVFLISITCFSQEIYSFKSGGRVFNSKNEKISPNEVRNLLVNNQPALELYEIGRNKKNFGNILLIVGSGCIVGDLALGLTKDKVYPTTLTYIGIPSLVLAIPIKIGFSKKIKKAVEMLNEDNSKPKTTSIEATSIIANANGVGVSITF